VHACGSYARVCETHPPINGSPECVAIANGLAGLDGPVINCVTRDYITGAADSLYYIRLYVRVAGGLRVTYVPCVFAGRSRKRACTCL